MDNNADIDTDSPLLDHYNNPRNVGSMNKKDLDVGTGLVGAPACKPFLQPPHKNPLHGFSRYPRIPVSPYPRIPLTPDPPRRRRHETSNPRRQRHQHDLRRQIQDLWLRLRHRLQQLLNGASPWNDARGRRPHQEH